MKKLILFALIALASTTINAQICLKTADGSAELKLIAAGSDTKDMFVTYKGQTEKIKLKFVKESIKICNECAHPEVYNYYNEVRDDKLTGGTYVIHYKENKYELTYTRFTDKKNFVFTSTANPENCTW